ncbi:MAG: DnaJ C-terminal domain-containing protein [Cyanobacteria bacterium J06623_7]
MSSTEFKDYYAILGVKKTADAKEIKQKFRQLALKYHPDRNQGNKAAETKFKEISEAYDVLSDADKRAKYDRFGQYWQQGASTPGYSSPGTSAGNSSNNAKVDFNTTDFSQYGNFDEFINELLGRFSTPNQSSHTTSSSTGTNPRTSSSKANPRTSSTSVKETTVHLTYKEAFYGTVKQLNLGLETIEIRIPAGAKANSRIRLPGKGASAYGSPRSDLYLNVELASHPFFDFEGDNLVCEVPISPDEAVLGTLINLPTPDGRVNMKIPPGINSGQVLRLRGKGWSSPQGNRTDQLVRILVITPKNPSSALKKCYEKIRTLRQENPRSNLEKIEL